MSTENTNDGTQEQNLDDFATELFGESNAATEDANLESPEDDGDAETDATPKDDTQPEADDGVDDTTEEADSEDEDALASEEDEDEESPDEPKKTRFQKRIDELTAKAKEEERQRRADKLDYEARINALEAKLGQDDQKPKDSTPAVNDLVEPSPTDKNEDGTDKYPLGEYDPKFIKDTAKHTFDAEFARREAAANQSKQEAEMQAQKAALENSWTEKLAPAQERYPDFREKGESLVDTFSGIDASYGEYLSTALMALDNGPDVLYYLASNPEEADQIVASGPMKATAALGRIDYQFGATQKQTSAPRKVSKAPAPPPRNKGSAVSKGSFIPDGDDVDLDALSRELAKKSY